MCASSNRTARCCTTSNSTHMSGTVGRRPRKLFVSLFCFVSFRFILFTRLSATRQGNQTHSTTQPPSHISLLFLGARFSCHFSSLHNIFQVFDVFRTRRASISWLYATYCVSSLPLYFSLCCCIVCIVLATQLKCKPNHTQAKIRREKCELKISMNIAHTPRRSIIAFPRQRSKPQGAHHRNSQEPHSHHSHHKNNIHLCRHFACSASLKNAFNSISLMLCDIWLRCQRENYFNWP